MARTELQSRLEADLEEVEWDALKPHLARDALVHVAPELPIVKAAMAVALDCTEDVAAWMQAGTVAKVTEAMAAGWDDQAKFRFLIVQPFVIIQPVADEPEDANSGA